jgi:hypothetical protein
MQQKHHLPYGSLVIIVGIVLLFIALILLASPQRSWPSQEKTSVGFAARIIQPTVTTGALSENTCADSDKGIAYFTQGVVTGFMNNKYYKYADFCTRTTTLTEYYCEKQKNGVVVKTQSVDCSQMYGKSVICKEGRCTK